MIISKKSTFYTGVNASPKQHDAAYTIPSSETDSTTVYNSSTQFYYECIGFQPSVQQLET